jgi:MFS family permease
MAVLDTTIVNVALPSIQQGAHASSDALEWVVSGYALTFGLAYVPAGPARRQVRLQTALPHRSSLGELSTMRSYFLRVSDGGDAGYSR